MWAGSHLLQRFQLLHYLTLPNLYHILTNSYKPGLFTILASSPYDTVCPGPIFFAKVIHTLSWNEPAIYNKLLNAEHTALVYFKTIWLIWWWCFFINQSTYSWSVSYAKFHKQLRAWMKCPLCPLDIHILRIHQKNKNKIKRTTLHISMAIYPFLWQHRCQACSCK